MALDIQGILDVIVSHALSTGYFDSVNQHESKKSASNGISASVWIERITPVKSSGLNSTTVRVELTMRLYNSAISEPYDDVDPNLAVALDALLRAYCGDFELGGRARHIDVFGAYGGGLESRSGWLNMDGKEFRVFAVRIPIIINDLWDQAP